jgi:hypothetical protein
MSRKTLAVGVACVLVLNDASIAAMYVIHNPAETIDNPAGRIHNPASDLKNPAGNIYNPATRINNPDPLSPPSQPTEIPTELNPVVVIKDQPPAKPAIPLKYYNFKSVRTYIVAAKRAFVKDDYKEFISITEDALRRIHAGTLKASRKSLQKLNGYRLMGYGLLDQRYD